MPHPLIRLVVCEDHALVREGLIRSIESDDRFVVVGQATDCATLLAQLKSTSAVRAVLLDLALGRVGAASGMEVISAVKREHPRLPILVVSMHDDPEMVHLALQTGAEGFVSKGSALQVLHEAIIQVVSGNHFLAPELIESVVRTRIAPPSTAWDAELTLRERQVFALICAGQRLKQIAELWGVSIKTVSTHKVNLMEKLEIQNNAQLIRFGIEQGLG